MKYAVKKMTARAAADREPGGGGARANSCVVNETRVLMPSAPANYFIIYRLLALKIDMSQMSICCHHKTNLISYPRPRNGKPRVRHLIKSLPRFNLCPAAILDSSSLLRTNEPIHSINIYSSWHCFPFPPSQFLRVEIMAAAPDTNDNAIIIAEEEPILSRLDRVDNILRQLEDMRGHRWSPSKSSCASSSGTLTSDDGGASFDFSPTSLEKHCRPLSDVITDTEHKGSLVQRLVFVEDKLLKFEEQLIEAERKRQEKKNPHDASSSNKKGWKQLVTSSCMKPARRKNVDNNKRI